MPLLARTTKTACATIEELNAKKLQVAGKTLVRTAVGRRPMRPQIQRGRAQKLVDGGESVMGPYCSGVAIPASPRLRRKAASDVHRGHQSQGDEGGYKHVFRIIAGDNQIGSSMATYAAKVMKAKTAAVVDDRTAFGQGVAAEFIKEAKAQGLTIVGPGIHHRQGHRLLVHPDQHQGQKPDVMFYGGYAPQAAPHGPPDEATGGQHQDAGRRHPSSPEMGKLGGDAVNDMVFCAQGGSMLDKTNDGPAFKAKYKKRFNLDADAYAASFYDQMLLIGQSMVKAGSTDPEKVAAEMRKGSYKGVVGTLRL